MNNLEKAKEQFDIFYAAFTVGDVSNAKLPDQLRSLAAKITTNLVLAVSEKFDGRRAVVGK